MVTTSESVGSEFCYTTTVRDYHITDTINQNGHQYFEIGYNQVYWSNELWLGADPQCNSWPLQGNSGSAGLLRSEGGRIYRALNQGEEMLYDFTLNVGDTVFWDNNSPHYVVDSIDQLMVGLNDCKRLWVNAFNSISNPVWIIENVGHQHGLFETMIEFENTGNMCYKEHDVPVVYYDRDGFSNPCLLTSLESQEQEAFRVSPNPSSGIFNLTIQQQFSYQVYDLFGRLIQTGAGSANAEIDLRSEPDGIYLLRIESKKGSQTQKLVKQ